MKTYNGKQPVALSFNTPGWEDSLSVNWAGNCLTFSYSRVDYFHFLKTGKVRLAGPVRQDTNISGADIYVGFKWGRDWMVANVGAPINTVDGMEGCQQLTEDFSTMYFSRNSQLYKCVHGMQPVLLTGLPAGADNPWVMPNGTIYYDLIENGEHHCYYTTGRSTGRLFYNEGRCAQPWASPDGSQLIYTWDFKEIRWVHDGQTKALVSVEPGSAIISVGEGTMDYKGNLYFVAVTALGDDKYDCNCYVLPSGD